MADARLIGATMRQHLERRRQDRRPLGDDPLASADGGEATAIINVSEHGFKAISMKACQPGDTIVVTIRASGPFEARIVWRQQTVIGCEFATPLDGRMLAAIINASA